MPYDDSIHVGDVEVPRLLDTDKIRAEDLNEIIESLSRYSESLKSRFHEIVRQETRTYWANIITLFGIFIGLFALILTSIGPSTAPPSPSFQDTFVTNLARVLPVGLVLLAFVVLLKVLFR